MIEKLKACTAFATRAIAMPPYCVPNLILDSERGNEPGDLLVNWERGNDIHQLQHVQERLEL